MELWPLRELLRLSTDPPAFSVGFSKELESVWGEWGQLHERSGLDWDQGVKQQFVANTLQIPKHCKLTTCTCFSITPVESDISWICVFSWFLLQIWPSCLKKSVTSGETSALSHHPLHLLSSLKHKGNSSSTAEIKMKYIFIFWFFFKE